MPDLADLLWTHTWWAWIPGDRAWNSLFVHWFNLFEGAAWWTLAGLVLGRYRRHRHSPLELAYSAAFLTFGLTDFYEAFALTSWLLWVKLANLIALLRLRKTVMRRWYPVSRVY